MINIFLIRHMETKWNEELRYIGSTDLALTEFGIANAAKLAEYLKLEKIDRVYSSGLIRSIQTADALANGDALKIEKMTELNEIDFGLWEGLTHQEIVSKYPREMAKWLEDPKSIKIPGGENWTVFEDRVVRGLDRIVKVGRGTIAIVTHGGPIKVMCGQALLIPPERYWQIYQDKGAVNQLTYNEGLFRIVKLNDTCYRR